MTEDMMHLRAPMEKNPNADILREMIGFELETRINLARPVIW